MKILKQGSYMNWVRRINSEELISEASLIETEFEGSAELRFKADTYEITDARWSIHRARNPECRGEGQASVLIGESAYIDDNNNSIRKMPDYSLSTPYNLPPGGWIENVEEKPSLEADLNPEEVSPEWKNIRELFNETIRGAYQAEFYLLEERKLNSLAEYEKMWLSTRADYCRPYTGQMPEIEEWPKYTGAIQHYRRRDLYNKYIQLTFMDAGNDMIEAVGAYNDSFHEMSAEISYSAKTGIIKAMDTTVVRVPFAPCRELDHLYSREFIGLNLKEMKKRDIARILGGSMGCFHLLDVVADLAKMSKEIHG